MRISLASTTSSPSWPGLPSHASDVESRICKSDRIPRRLLRRIFRHEFTVWRRRSVDLILIQILTQPCVRQAAGATLMVRFFSFVEILWTRISNKVVFCISGSCWKPIRTLQFEAQELSSAPLHCCPSISVFVNYVPIMLSFIICFCHRAVLATFDDQVLCKVN